jgi:hypothetical protein
MQTILPRVPRSHGPTVVLGRINRACTAKV